MILSHSFGEAKLTGILCCFGLLTYGINMHPFRSFTVNSYSNYQERYAHNPKGKDASRFSDVFYLLGTRTDKIFFKAYKDLLLKIPVKVSVSHFRIMFPLSMFQTQATGK